MKYATAAILTTCLIIATGTPSWAAPSNQNPITEPLLQQSDLIYVGAFRLPEGSTNQTSFDYAGTGLAYDPTQNGLILTGHTWYQNTAEVSIPTPVSAATISALPTATFIQNFSDALDSKLNLINPVGNNNNQIGGYLVYNNQLVISAFTYYDGSGTQNASHFIRPLSLSTPNAATGPFRLGSQYPGFVSGYMTPIPQDWQSLLGGPAATGNCCLNIISEQSNGPALSVFNPGDLGSQNTVPVKPILGYPYSNPLEGAWGQQSDIFNGTTNITGVVFPPGTRSVLFFGRQGIGPFCYGIGSSQSPPPSGECYDPAGTSKGTHAYPYVYQIWAYDANDLLQVAQGKLPEYAPKPYAIWQFTLPFTQSTGSHQILGAAYDPTTNQLFISQACTDEACSPLIQVFRVTIPTSQSTTSSQSTTPSQPQNVMVQ